MIDTLKLSKGSEALSNSQGDYVTNKDLNSAIEKLKSEIQRFILVSFVLVAIAQILVIKVWH